MDKHSSQRQEWYVWTVSPGKFEVVRKYIKEKVPEINEVLYPAVTTETVTKKGEVKKKTTPLYAGYIFLQYHHDERNPGVWVKLQKHPFITRYVGPCTAQDLASVNSLQKVERDYDESVREFSIGDNVKVRSGVFAGFKGIVVGTTHNTVKVELHSLGRTLKVVFSPEDLAVLKEHA
jgi:transcription antitermination factor NusG